MEEREKKKRKLEVKGYNKCLIGKNKGKKGAKRVKKDVLREREKMSFSERGEGNKYGF